MRILKRKIEKVRMLNIASQELLVKEAINLANPPASSLDNNLTTQPTESVDETEISKRKESLTKSPQIKEGTCQNIVKNYSRAFISFALSASSVSYLNPILLEQNLDLDQFRTYLNNRKGKINCIKNLRSALLIKSRDSEKEAACKRVFRYISEIFLKYYSVNWLYNSKIANKNAHLNCRFKILRRIRKPEYFTYLEGFNS